MENRAKTILRGTALLLCLSYGMLILAFWQENTVQSRTNKAVCVAINNINSSFTESLHRGQHNLPKIAYFRNHPKELAQQQAEIRRELVLYKPRTCK